MALAFPALTVALRLLALDRYARHALLHQRARRQHDELRQPDLDLGPSGGLHPDPAGVRRVLRGRLDLLEQAPVRLPIAGLCHGGDRRPRPSPVWLHHFFTMGSAANVNAFFGVTTMIIAVPTGVKVFNWLFTMYRGRIASMPPMLWTDRLHRHLRHRRHDRRAAGHAAGRLRAAQHDCSWSRTSTT